MDNTSSLKISEEVIAKIVSVSSSEVAGFAGFAGGTGSEIRNFLNKKNPQRGIKVEIADDKVSVEANILVEYGAKITDIAAAVQETIIKNIENMTGYRVTKVDIVVSGINVKDESAKADKQ